MRASRRMSGPGDPQRPQEARGRVGKKPGSRPMCSREAKMSTKKAHALAAALCLTASRVLAEQVLYCVDTAAVGFVWDKKE